MPTAPGRATYAQSVKQHIVEMVGGPGTLRFIVQPTIAVVLGILHGLGDHRAGRPPYLIGLLHGRGSRVSHIVEGLRAIVVPLGLAVLGAYVFQFVIRGHIYFLYGLEYAVLFVAIPYFVTRALANRLAPNRVRPPTNAARA
jgi:hypothetical protein